jgi:Peptidase A4 family
MMSTATRAAAVTIVGVGLLVTSLAPSAAAQRPTQVQRSTAPQPAAAARSAVFAGYDVARQGSLTTTSARFVVPKITCRSRESGVGPSVALVNRRGTYSGAGVGVVCQHGKPHYQAIEVVADEPTDSFALAAGDHVLVSVRVTKSRATVSVRDLTSAAHRTLHGKGGLMTFAELGVQSISQGARTFGIDPFTATRITDAVVNGHSLKREHAYPTERVRGKVVQVTVGKLHKGKDFTVTFRHS